MKKSYKKKSYFSFKKGEYNFDLYSIPDSLVFNGVPGKEHYYIKDENGDLHQLNHLYVEDPNRKRKLRKGYYIKARSEGLFDNCPFLLHKENTEFSKKELDQYYINKRKVII